MAINSSNSKNIEGLLLSKGLLTPEQLEKARTIKNQTHEKIEDVIIRMGFLSEKQILDLWAEILGTSVVDLINFKIDAKLLATIPEELAMQKKIIPYKKEGSRLTVVMADPFDIMTTDMLTFLTKCEVSVVVAPKNQIDSLTKQLYSWDGFSASGDESLKRTEALAQEESTDSLELSKKTSEQGAVVQFLNAVFKQAIAKRASDIHVEPREENLLIRFRIDGILHDAMTGPKSLIAPLISRIKILSHLDIAERRLPQDGRLKVKMQDKEVDFRVSTVPSLLGEKAVMRLLQRESKFDLDNIGFFEDDLTKLKEVLDEPYGLVLVTGPTGAGKTTTLFGMLKYFNSSEINIFTIENPVEYRMSGITQVQINDKIGLDFASGLRAALRQDPDVILVGEIRDLETAEIAFRASLTGHKVLSTIHTNNAPATINRLINMGVPAYLVTAAVRGIVAQKLLHQNCPKCSTEYKPSPSVIQRLDLSPSKIIGHKFYKGIGCQYCNHTGIYGRHAAYETMILTSALKEVIMEGGTEAMIKHVARLEGMRTLRESALALAMDGKSTLEEVIYVTPPDDEEKHMNRGQIFGGMPYMQGGMIFQQPMQNTAVISDPTTQTSNQAVQPQIHMQPIQAPAPIQAAAATSETNAATDMNDPIMRAMANNIENEYLFIDDEHLSEKLHLPVLKVRELMQARGLERCKESFEQHFGNKIEDFSDEQAEDITRLITESGGEIPSYLISENEEHNEKWVKASVNTALNKLDIRPENLDDVPSKFTEEFLNQSGFGQILLWADNSRYKLINMVLPNKFVPWQFGELDKWISSHEDLSECAKTVIDWLVEEKLQCSRNEIPTAITKQVFIDNGLEIILNKFDGQCSKVVDAAYPGIFMPWQFPEEAETLWLKSDSKATAAKATRWLVEDRLGIPTDDVPKRVTARDFYANGLSSLLDFFSQNLPMIIENAYPMQFKPWQFSEQNDLWKSPDAMTTAKQAIEWMITERMRITHEKAPTFVTKRHFIANGLGLMLNVLFDGNPFSALEHLMPELKTDVAFQKTLYNYSQNIYEIRGKWDALAERIALNHFGKAKFRVTMPNMKSAPIVPENERVYINASNQIEYVPQIVIPKLSAYTDFSSISSWVPYCDRLSYWILGDDRASGYKAPEHPKVHLMFTDNMTAFMREKGASDLIDRLMNLVRQYNSLLDCKHGL